MDDYSVVSHDSDSVYATNSKGGKRFMGESKRVTSKFVTLKPELREDDSTMILVEPEYLQFDSMVPGILYVMTFSLRNTSKSAHRIRIQSPKSEYFALNYIPSGAVAPGLDIRGEIECQIPVDAVDMVFRDTIVATMGPYKIEIPLFASKQHADIKYDSLANIGYVGVGQVGTIDVAFENAGQISGSISFKLATQSRIKISPMKLELPPGTRGTITITLEGKDVGLWRELVHVNILGAITNSVLDVIAQVVEQKLTLLAENNGGIMELVNFGSLFYKEHRTVRATLVNTGPQPLNFILTYPDDDDGTKFSIGSDSNPQVDEGPPCETFFSVSPSDGTVQPYSEVPIIVNFDPVLYVPSKAFRKQFFAESTEPKEIQRRVCIETMETGQKFYFNMQAIVASPHVTVNPTILRFGTCPASERRDILITFTNKSSIEVPFEFSKQALFKVDPCSGSIQPRQTKTAVATFFPSQLGQFKKIITMSIADGLSIIDFKATAECDSVGTKKVLIGGTDKLPEDFKVEYKFVDPDEVAATRKAKLTGQVERKQLGLTSSDGKGIFAEDYLSSSSSKERDAIYGMASDAASESGLTIASNHPWNLKRENDQRYNDFLIKSRTKRIEGKERETMAILDYRGINRKDPFGVDMGMERDLDEPILHIPKAGDSLYMINNGGDGEGSRNRIPIDENRLIQKKYSPNPATQAEMKDCTCDLSAEDLKLITASHKVLDFGRVCVNSLAAKNFAVVNDMEHAVLVKIDVPELELKQSKPEAQVIPKGAIAGFDMHFTSKVLGKFKKTFSWVVNSKAVIKVSVVAEVVPIELVLSKTHLKMEFPPDLLEKSMTEDIILTNPGNAPAEFLWGSSGAFECRPEKGNISPGQSTIISVQWTPMIGKRNDEELGLHIPGGVDQTLKVEGILNEGKAEFVDKRVAIGTVAIGMEKTMTVRMKNTGANLATFFINQPDPRHGLSITPECGLIKPGEISTLTLAINARSAIMYDNIAIMANIRGGKTINFRLSGESIVPQFSLDEKNFQFGSVAVGSSFTLPFRISNNCAITSCLVLDLSKYQDFGPLCKSDEENLRSIVQMDSEGNKMEMVTSTFSPLGNNTKSTNIWKITLNANSTLNASIVFTPSIPKNHSFKLPLYMMGIPEDKSLYCDVSADGIQSRLELSTGLIEFGDRVVSRDPLSRTSYYLELHFKNIDAKSGLAYEIRDSPTKMRSKENAEQGFLPVNEQEGPPIFFISPMRGELAVASSAPVRITFMPSLSGEYEKNLDIYITGQPDPSRPYISVACRGCGVFPRLTFDRQLVQLPTVPLGVTSRSMFRVVNNGFSHLVLKYRASPTIPLPLAFTFPDGMELNANIQSIRVIVGTKSDNPVSWTGKIEFTDDNGERFSVYACGCSDNCVLTNYPFLKLYSDRYNFIGLDEQPTKFLLKSEILILRAQDAKRKEQLRRQRMLERQKLAGVVDSESTTGSKKKLKNEESVDSLSKISVVSDSQMGSASAVEEGNEGIDIEREAYQLYEVIYNDAETKILLKWLNKMVCRIPFDIDRFPECITESYGDLFIDCVEQMSGKKITGVKPGVGEVSNRPRNGPGELHGSVSQSSLQMATANKLVAKYQVMLNWLIRSGALLNHIHPISLLGFDDYLLAQEAEMRKVEGYRVSAFRIQEMKTIWAKNWSQLCKFCWSEALFQCLKIFVLSRVAYKDFIKMPGVTMEQNDIAERSQSAKKKGKNAGPVVPPEFSGSNVYSQAEAVILGWTSYHLQRASFLVDEGAPDAINPSQGFGMKKRVVDIEGEFKDFFGFCQLMHSHIPESTQAEGPLHGYTAGGNKGNRDDMYYHLQKCLDYTRLEFGMTIQEMSSSGRSILLLLLHLFLNLPNFIPKTKIEFRGMLGSPITKTIELKNPSKKQVFYNVTLRGCQDFVLQSKELSIPPMSAVDFTVTLNACFTEPVSAVITFWGVRDSGVAGLTMVFQLVSVITGRKPLETFKRSVPLFDFDSFPIHIQNPFSKDCVLPLTLNLQYAPLEVKDLNRADGRKAKTAVLPTMPLKSDETSEDRKLTEEQEIEKMYRQPIWCSDESVTLPNGGSKTITVSILPFMLGTYTCQIVLLDPNSGEFCYDVIAEIGLPKPAERLEFNAFVSKSGVAAVNSLRMSSKNAIFEKALEQLSVLRLSNPSKKTKARSIFQNLLASPLVNPETGESIFCIDVLSPFFTCPKTIGFVSEYMNLQQQGQQAAPGARKEVSTTKFKKTPKTTLDQEISTSELIKPLNCAVVTFRSDKAGTYPAKLIIYSKDNKYDIRVVELIASAKMEDAKMIIEFKGPARQKLTQDIPVINESDKDWNLTATIFGKGFSGPRVLFVPKEDKATLTLSFCGAYAGNFDGTLKLFNPDGIGDNFAYTLNGIAEDPLAEDHLHFRCKARTKSTFTIPLHQIFKPIVRAKNGKDKNVPKDNAVPDGYLRYSVETDMPYLVGQPFIDIPESGGSYEFSVNSPVGGIMSGSITFTDLETGGMIWYTVDVDVTSPAAERTIEVDVVVRKAVAVEIMLDNPTKETLEFNVSFDGDGLLGDARFVLPPGNSKENADVSYELIYSPLVAGQFVGKISFVNDRVGEFWYRLNLNAIPAPPTVVETIESMLGSRNFVQVPIENPLPHQVDLLVHVSDPEHFQVTSDTITLLPYAQSSFQVFFRPSSLTDTMLSDVKVSHPSFGELEYKLSGRALLPGNMPPTFMFAPLSEIGSHTLVFRNPFPHPLPVDVVMSNQSALGTNSKQGKGAREETDVQVFAILLKKCTDIMVAGKSLLHISVSFSPTRLVQFTSSIQVRSMVGGRNLLWCFPLIGMAEAGIPQELPSIVTPCKTSVRKDVDIYLKGLYRADLNGSLLKPSDFSVEIKTDKKNEALVTRAFRIQLLDIIEVSRENQPKRITLTDEDVDYMVRYRLLFEPLRTFSTNAEIIVSCENKGRWRVNIDLRATDPEPDDRIQLVAQVGSSDKVSFRLNNRFLGYSSFQAYFSERSSKHLSVSPSSGVLAPFGAAEGTQFIVSFTPKNYETSYAGTLIITTDDAQWNYEVIGTFPDFNVHAMSIKSKVDSGLG